MGAWWKLDPHPELVTGKSKALPVIESGAPIAPALCLAQPGERYVIYLRQGGTATLQLAAGRYAVKRYNPRTGLSVSAGEANGGNAWTLHELSDTKPWVLLLEKKA
jgi:hypothetical protein